jgi:hypothetical protein
MISPGKFNPELYYYDKVKYKRLHPTVQTFLNYSKSEYIKIFCNKYPGVNEKVLKTLVEYKPKHFFWSGVDLYHVHADKMIVLETNSCPSGQKSMPERNPGFGYLLLMRRFLELAKEKTTISGVLAVLYDKNYMEVSGYAKQLANLANETVHFIEIDEIENSSIHWKDNILYIFCKDSGIFLPVRAAFRYVTQKPWAKIPLSSRTFIFNSVLTCLAGGRNKLVAHKAYEQFNREFLEDGIQIFTPDTVCDVVLNDIPRVVRDMNFRAVIKIPYSNAGQGVFTIHNEKELDEFMIDARTIPYQKYIIQNLVVSSGTRPDNDGNKYVWDLRFMLYSCENGYEPLVMYARKAVSPLVIETDGNSRDIYLTNLSEKTAAGWTTHSERLIIMDEEEFGSLNIEINNLVDAYFQSLFATIAIDKMADQLFADGSFLSELFHKLNNDVGLLEEIR